jgi:NADPH2:quinone reductase
MGEAVFARAIGGPEVLSLEAHDPGEPGAGQVRIAVGAAGVNFIDVYLRTGLYSHPRPFICGLEGAGRVEAVGPGASDLAVGDRVAWAGVPGSYATHLLAPADRVVPVPAGVDETVAAAAMLQGMTAHYLTHGCREPQRGDVALVHAAAGGTGALLVQMLCRAGVRVIGTCSTEAKAELARSAGAEHVIRYTEEDFTASVLDITDGAGVDVVYDSVGRTTFEDSLACLRRRGLLVLFGQSSGPVPAFDLNRLNGAGSLFVTRPSLAHYTAAREELLLRATAVLGAVANGALALRIGEVFPLARAADAHRALESRRTAGKLLLRTA